MAFGSTLCALFPQSNDVRFYQGKEENLKIKVPEIGNLVTIQSSDVLLISGTKGFAIFNENLNCVFKIEPKFNIKDQILYADMHNKYLNLVFDR